MGLFSSSYKYYAYAGSSPLFEDDDRPETVKSNIVQSITTNKFSVTSAIRFGLGTDMFARAKSMYKYASKPDGYKWGFPSTGEVRYAITQDMLRPPIEAEAGGPIDFNASQWGPGANYQWFWIEMGIQDNYASWPWPSGAPDDPLWSYDKATIQIPVVNPDTTDYYEASNLFDASVVSGVVTVSFNYTDNLGASQTYVAPTFNISAFLNPGDEWIAIRYRLQSDHDHILYWYYLIGSGDDPVLEAALGTAELNMNYMPIAIMMHDEVWFDEAGDTEWEKTLDRLLKDLALDPYEIKEQYLEQQAEDDASGDVAKSNAETWDFFIHFAVPLKTQWRGGQEYLFRFYQFLRTYVSWTTFDTYNTWVSGGAVGEQPNSKLNVEEGVEYTGYIARYAWSYISEVTVVGEFTPPDWDEPLVARKFWSKTYQFGTAGYNTGLDLVHGPGMYAVAGSQPDGQEHSYTIITRMNEDNTHTHILMMGPSMEYQINTSATPVGVGSGGYVDYQYRFVDVELFPEDTLEESEFRWPVHINSLKEVSVIHREGALVDGLCSTVFLVERVKVKWYQKGFWKWLIIIIAVVLIVLSIIFPGFVATASLLISAAFGGGALAAYIIYYILVFAIGFIISMAGNLIGGTWGTVFAVIGMLIVGARAGMAGGPGAISGQSSSAWGSAVSLINTTSPYIQGGLKIYQAFELQKLEDQMKEFIKTAKEKYQELRDAWDMLGGMGGNIDPISLSAQFENWYVEAADDFFQRTLNANPGILGYDLVNNFAGLALMLPEDGNDGNVVLDMFEQFEQQRGAV